MKIKTFLITGLMITLLSGTSYAQVKKFLDQTRKGRLQKAYDEVYGDEISGREVNKKLFNTPPSKDPFKSFLPEKKAVIPIQVKKPPKPGKPPPTRETIQQLQQKQTPAVIAEILPPTLEIKGLIWNSDRPQAIVNDQIVEVGDKVEEAIIKSIEKDGIRILFRGKEFPIESSLF